MIHQRFLAFKVFNTPPNVAVCLHFRGTHETKGLLKIVRVISCSCLHPLNQKVIAALTNSSLCRETISSSISTNSGNDLEEFPCRTLTCCVKLKCLLAESSKCTKKIGGKLENSMYMYFLCNTYVSERLKTFWESPLTMRYVIGSFSLSVAWITKKHIA